MERICLVGYPIIKGESIGALYKMEGTIDNIEFG